MEKVDRPRRAFVGLSLAGVIFLLGGVVVHTMILGKHRERLDDQMVMIKALRSDVDGLRRVVTTLDAQIDIARAEARARDGL